MPDKKKKCSIPGYPLYPAREDIYNKFEEARNIDPEEISMDKKPNDTDEDEPGNEKDLSVRESGSNLDVPGSELDDEQERIGSEDEENNYYSLGGDDHEDLDEDKGE